MRAIQRFSRITTASSARACRGSAAWSTGPRATPSFAVFASPMACVTAALEMQRDLRNHDWPAGEQLRVRMGIHTGEATQASTGMVGYEVPGSADRRRRLRGSGPGLVLDQGSSVTRSPWYIGARSRFAPSQGPGAARGDLPIGRRRPRRAVPSAALARQPSTLEQPPGPADQLCRARPAS